MKEPLILVMDVDYRDGNIGVAAGVRFIGWDADTALNQSVVVCHDIAPYVPGAFYQRELPCLLKVLNSWEKPDFIVVDGYVWTGEGKMGLGAHLAIETTAEVIGVAKTQYAGAPSCEVLRGESIKPLYVTAGSIDADQAGAYIKQMHGHHRLPTMMKLVDRICRDHRIV